MERGIRYGGFDLDSYDQMTRRRIACSPSQATTATASTKSSRASSLQASISSGDAVLTFTWNDANSIASIAVSANARAIRKRRDCKSTCKVAASSWRGTNQQPRSSAEEFFREVTNKEMAFALTFALRSMSRTGRITPVWFTASLNDPLVRLAGSALALSRTALCGDQGGPVDEFTTDIMI